MFYDVFKSLCDKKNVAPCRVAVECNFNKANITKWSKNGNIPKQEILLKIADYFDVSVDYLLGKEENKTTEQSELENIKVALYGGDGEVTKEMWEEVRKYAEFIAKRESDKNK